MQSLLLLLTLSCDPAVPTGGWLATLQSAWAPRPQWADMAFAILEGRTMDPRGGWWESGGSRFGWERTCRSFDRDRDGRILPAEIPVQPERFVRLDRDGDGAITEVDFQPPRDLGGDAGDIFDRFDRDSNGRLTRAELDELFRAADDGGLGFLSQEDFAAALAGRVPGAGGAAPPPASPPPGSPSPPLQSRGPPRWALLWMLFSRQLGSLEEGPAIGDPAPDFILRERGSLLGTPLREALGKKPIILVFGSFT